MLGEEDVGLPAGAATSAAVGVEGADGAAGQLPGTRKTLAPACTAQHAQLTAIATMLVLPHTHCPSKQHQPRYSE